METPFNENLVLASTGCQDEVIADLIPCVPAANTPGYRNEFHAGFQQAVGRYIVISGEYIWKYTHTGYDFSVLAATPITFPIGWPNSKIPGYLGRVSVPKFHGLTAFGRLIECGGTLLPTSNERSWCHGRTKRRRLPNRPRREVQPDDAHTVSARRARTLGRLQLAI
jgi:hypothetical protein